MVIPLHLCTGEFTEDSRVEKCKEEHLKNPFAPSSLFQESCGPKQSGSKRSDCSIPGVPITQANLKLLPEKGLSRADETAVSAYTQQIR